MPAAWNGKFDAEIVLESELGMKYKQKYLTTTPGAKVKFTFRNPDDMEHNFVLTSGKMGDKVGLAAADLGLQGPAIGYIPDMPEVLVHTKLVPPETEDTIYFTAPHQAGNLRIHLYRTGPLRRDARRAGGEGGSILARPRGLNGHTYGVAPETRCIHQRGFGGDVI